MGLTRKIAYNTIIQIAGKLVSTFLGIVALAMMTRYLGTSGFGEYTTIITFISFFAIVADLGLTLVTAQMISGPVVNEAKILNNIFSLRLVTALVFLGLAPAVVLFFPYSAEMKTGVIVISISFLFVALNQVLVGLFQKKLVMDRVSIAEIISRIFLVIGIWLVWKMNGGLLGVMWATVISSAISFVLHLLFSRSYVHIKFDFNLTVWKDIVQRSIPLGIIIFFNLIYLRADTLILSVIKTQHDVGIYGSAYKIIDVLTTLPFMFAGLVLPILTRAWYTNNKRNFRMVFERSFNFMMIVAVPLVVGAQFASDRLMIIIAGSEFSEAGPILRILILAIAAIFVTSIFSHAIIAANQQRKLIGVYAFVSVTGLVGYLYFIPLYSYFGAAWMTVYCEAFIAIATIYFARKIFYFLPSIRILLKTIFASLVMGLFLFFIPDYVYQSTLLFAIIMLSAVIIYSAVLYAIGGISRDEIREMLNKK